MAQKVYYGSVSVATSKKKKGKNLNIAGGFISETLLVFPEQQHIEVRRKCTESAALKLSSVFISLGQFREDQ